MFVYLLITEDRKMFKIGKSVNVLSRIETLPYNFNTNASSIYFIGESVFKVEKSLHNLLEHYNIKDLQKNDGYTEFFDIKALKKAKDILEISGYESSTVDEMIFENVRESGNEIKSQKSSVNEESEIYMNLGETSRKHLLLKYRTLRELVGKIFNLIRVNEIKLTQKEFAESIEIPYSSLRGFLQTGDISLKYFLKILEATERLDGFIDLIEPRGENFGSRVRNNVR